jgi:hypothetical protein
MASFRERDPELDTKIGRRKERLKGILKRESPSLVICYGDGSGRDAVFAELLDVDWRPVCHRVSASSDTRCFLLPFFGCGQMSYPVFEVLSII